MALDYAQFAEMICAIHASNNVGNILRIIDWTYAGNCIVEVGYHWHMEGKTAVIHMFNDCGSTDYIDKFECPEFIWDYMDGEEYIDPIDIIELISGRDFWPWANLNTMDKRKAKL